MIQWMDSVEMLPSNGRVKDSIDSNNAIKDSNVLNDTEHDSKDSNNRIKDSNYLNDTVNDSKEGFECCTEMTKELI